MVYRSKFLNLLADAYSVRHKNIILLTGDIHDTYWSEGARNFVSLEQTLYQELKEKFTLLRMDVSTGLSFYDETAEEEVIRVSESTDGVKVPKDRVRDLRKVIEENRHNPLPTLVLLDGLVKKFIRVREFHGEKNLKPLCVILQYAGALFPAGEFTRLSELDKQRLVLFLGLASDPLFVGSPELFMFINPVKSEVNQKILSLPNAAHIEIPLPDGEERKQFAEQFVGRNKEARLEMGLEKFAENTAGLSLVNLEDMFEVALRTNKPLTNAQITAEVDQIIQAQLGDIVRINRPQHRPSDIIGYEETVRILRSIFERCEDPETAFSAILVSGPNGGGKTYQLEAFAAESGRVVIELVGLRGSFFGETDSFFEKLRWHIATFGKILILIDEAHTAFGSVHDSHTHETEKRLAGNIIKMMGDQRYLGKVLWALMTSRPDELDPDVKSRAPVQIPVFDLEGESRKLFVKEMFTWKKIEISDEELDLVLKETGYYSARDFRNLIAEVKAARRKDGAIPVTEVLKGWRASRSIITQRELQKLIAAQHCSYPHLLPEDLKNMNENEISKKIQALKIILEY